MGGDLAPTRGATTFHPSNQDGQRTSSLPPKYDSKIPLSRTRWRHCIGRILSRVRAHSYAWGIHHRQHHLFTALVILHALLAQPAPFIVDTLSTYLSGRFSTNIARDHQRLIPGEVLDGFPLRFPFSFSHHLQSQFRCRAEIIFVVRRLPRTEYSAQLHTHTFIICTPTRIHARV